MNLPQWAKEGGHAQSRDRQDAAMVHIIPLCGKPHSISGAACWCRPEVSGEYIIHKLKKKRCLT